MHVRIAGYVVTTNGQKTNQDKGLGHLITVPTFKPINLTKLTLEYMKIIFKREILKII